MKTVIVGSQHQPGGVELISSLQRHDQVHLIREASNRYDRNAVAVHSNDGRRLGYIPKSMNAELACELDLGYKFRAFIANEAITQDGSIRFLPTILVERVDAT